MKRKGFNARKSRNLPSPLCFMSHCVLCLRCFVFTCQSVQGKPYYLPSYDMRTSLLDLVMCMVLASYLILSCLNNSPKSHLSSLNTLNLTRFQNPLLTVFHKPFAIQKVSSGQCHFLNHFFHLHNRPFL